MLKAAIIDFGHVDSIISLAKYLGRKIKVDLYLTFSQQYKFTSIVNFQNVQTSNGLLPQDLVRKVLGKEIIEYLRDHVHINIFIYKNPNIRDIKNYLLFKALSDHLKKNKYDVIHLNGNSFFEIMLHWFLKRIPRAHTIHDVQPHTGEGSWKSKMRMRNLRKQDIEFILQSDFSLNQFLEIEGFKNKRAYSVYYGPLEIYKSYADENEKEQNNRTILFYGRISPYKGIEYLVKAVKIIKDKIPDVKLIIAGKGEIYFNTDDIINDNSFEIINRYISNNELTELIKKSAVIVCPYTDATQSGVVMTSYAFKKPVVASSVGGFNDVIENGVTGILVPPKDPESLANALTTILCEERKLEEISANIDELKSNSKLSWDIIAEKTISVYNQAIMKQKKN